jgi:hypothetical protein
MWKEDQTPQLAVARSFDASTWERLGLPSGGWFENAQLLPIDNVWHLLATGEGQRPFVARLSADPNRPRDWLRWNAPTELKVPRESFNTHDVANAAFLADWRALDGYFYLLYAGNTEGESHAGRGDNRLGLARSKDLQQWSVPPIE